MTLETTTAPCPICSASTVSHCTKRALERDWPIRRCTDCGHGFVADRPTPAELDRVYTSDPHFPSAVRPTPEQLRQNAAARELARGTASLTPLRGRTLDVGCGSGAFSYHLHEAGFSHHLLIDPDPRLASVVDYIPRAEFQPVGIEDLTRGERFDAVVMSQVLEHALNPAAWLTRAAAVLNPRGVLAIAVPNFAGLYRLLGCRDPMLLPPFHLNFFTPRSLTLSLRAAGLRKLRMDSTSRIRPSPRMRGVAPIWNTLSRPLDATPRGIVLRVYATPASERPGRSGPSPEAQDSA